MTVGCFQVSRVFKTSLTPHGTWEMWLPLSTSCITGHTNGCASVAVQNKPAQPLLLKGRDLQRWRSQCVYVRVGDRQGKCEESKIPGLVYCAFYWPQIRSGTVEQGLPQTPE